MAVVEGLYKTVAYKKQTALGTPAAGAGGTLLRRETATFAKTKSTYDANEIVAHQQDTGITYLVSQTQGELNGVLSAGSYAPLLGSLVRATFTAGTSSTGRSITIAGTGPTFTLTDAGASFLSQFNLGDVIQITAGTYTGVAKNINLVITALTNTVITVVVPNGKTLTAQGPVASSTIACINKKAMTPSTGQANDYYTFEEFYPDASPTLSRVYSDTQIASADISVPANAAASIKLAMVGLTRTKGSAQILTSPSAAPATSVIGPSNAVILINAAQTAVGTSLSLKIDGQVTPGEATIGSKTISDTVKGDLKVSGTFTVLKQDETNSNLFDNETPIGITCVLFADTTDGSDFVAFTMPRVKITKDEVDDGKKQLVSTHDFVAEYNIAGGSSLATATSIITIQDSQA